MHHTLPAPTAAPIALNPPRQARAFQPPALPPLFRLGGSLVLAASTVLGGCALAPGVYIKDKVQATAVPADAPPPGALIEITPTLVRALRAVPEIDPTQDLAPFLVEPEAYRIGPADILSVVVWGSPDFSSNGGSAGGAAGGTGPGTGFTVSSKGFIQMPFVGSVKAAGLTEEELKDKLNELLQSVLRRPQVTVAVQAYRSGRIYVDGEVRTPGQQVINDVPMSLPEALTRAGGLSASADRSSVSLTRGVKTVRINIDQLTNRGIDPQRILLARGDTVRVGSNEETRVYVLGEVNTPGPKPLRKGRLTLHEALGDSGGVSTASGDPRQIFVVRVTDPLKPEIFHLDAASPVSLALADGFDLKPRDVVYVDPVPLVRWNRVINLILPSASAVVTTRVLTNSGTN